MHRHRPIIAFILLLLSLSVSVQATTFWPKPNSPQRIISLSPQSTEILFALGVGQYVIAVSDYCDYPEQVNDLTRVGSLFNPNLEQIVGLRPDLVIFSRGQSLLASQLQQLGIETLAVSGRRLSDITESIELIGKAVGQQAVAKRILAGMQEQFGWVRRNVNGQPKPSVLISLAHHLDNADGAVYISGQHDFYNDLLKIAGAENAYQLPYPKVPYIAYEGLLKLDPDIIIDILPDSDDHDASIAELDQHWQQLSALRAVQLQRVHILEADYATIPGPRVGKLVIELAKTIHPTLDWSEVPVVTP